MGREDLAARFAEKLNLPKEEKRLQCLECSGNSYEECYRQGQIRTCGSTETSCMLEVRFEGSVNSKNGPQGSDNFFIKNCFSGAFLLSLAELSC